LVAIGDAPAQYNSGSDVINIGDTNLQGSNTTTDLCGVEQIVLGNPSITDTVIYGNIEIKNGSNVVYRCATAGALPQGTLTIIPGNCGTTADTGLRVQ